MNSANSNNSNGNFLKFDLKKNIESHQKRAKLLIAIAISIVFLWGSVAKISGAVASPGNIKYNKNTKDIQHRYGGIISEVLVNEGDEVIEDQVIIRLDSRVNFATLESLNNQTNAQRARLIRLFAERDKLDKLPIDVFQTPEIRSDLEVENRLFLERRNTKKQKISSLQEHILTLKNRLLENSSHISILQRQRRMQENQVATFDKLIQHKAITMPEKNSAERELVVIEGDLIKLNIANSEAKAEIIKSNLQILDISSTFMTEVLNEIRDTQSLIVRLIEQKIAAEDELERAEIRAPVSGRVQALKIHTKGGTIAPGDVLMSIAPKDDTLIVEAKVDPKFIDQVEIGRDAKMHFTSFSTSTTPVVHGKVKSISSDIVTGENNEQFYLARLEISDMNLPKVIKGRLVAGMPVETFISTGDRVALSYFLKPVTDQLNRAFNDD